MCHWVLRVWKCGDSFFTKYSSCSFDRAAHDPSNLLNPLHPSIIPTAPDSQSTSRSTEVVVNQRNKDATKNAPTSKCKSTSNGTAGACTMKSTGNKALPRSPMPSIDLSTPANTHTTVSNGTKVVYPCKPKTGQTIPIPFSEIGKASRFGDKTLESDKCNVFEVVLQSKEETMCPACVRSPKRAKLPAHARGCFGLS